MPYYQYLQQSALISLFELDLTPIGVSSTLRFCNYSEANGSDIFFGGNRYTAYPIDATGFEKALSGSLPTAELKVSNVFSTVSALIISNSGIVGAKLTRYKVFAINLDGHPGSTGAIESTDVWYISRYVENAIAVNFTLKHPLEIADIKIPRRRMVSLID